MMPARPRRNRYSTQKQATAASVGYTMLEDELQDNVNKFAQRIGLFYWRDTASNRLAALGDRRRNKKGFLDNLFIGGWPMFVELKTDTGPVKPDQRQMMERLERAGADVRLFRTADWKSGRIQAAMQACADAAKRSPDGGIELPDLGKLLFLLVDTSQAAGLHWDAGSRHVDKITWNTRAADLITSVAVSLPATDDQVRAWLTANRLPANAKPTEVLAALRRALISGSRDRLNGDQAA